VKQFKAITLEEAYEKATTDFKCSINNLNIKIVQQEKKGFFGFFKKEAIIKAQRKPKYKKQSKVEKVVAKPPKEVQEDSISQEKEKIFDDFYSSNDAKATHEDIIIKKDESVIVEEIKVKINELFEHTCYTLDEIKVCFYDDDTIYVEFQGKDAALLIGKEGYRYKALSYILFNWIHEKYNLMLRLEVAQFLATQEESIYNYLVPVIQTIKDDGFYKTKPLDGVLVHIALKKLREEFPQKYVAVKTNVKGDRYILVNEYRK
jgi:spoIIIJ-associated protein